MSYNAVQIALKSIHFDRRTRRSMWGYVVGLVQRNTDGSGQLFISDGSFRVRRDNDPKTRVDQVYTYDADGKIIFSTQTDGLESINLSLFFIRDRRRLREFGALLENTFSENELGAKIAKAVADSLKAGNPVGSLVFELVPEAMQFVGKLMAEKRDQVLIRAEGSLRMSTIADLVENDMDDAFTWGESQADKGFFTIDVDLVTMTNPHASVTFVTFPDALRDRVAGIVNEQPAGAT